MSANTEDAVKEPGVRCIKIRGARVHNLKNISLDIPLGEVTAIAGLSGSGKSSLALGVLYAEGSRRYLEALSAYTRRRMTQASEAKVESLENIPAAIALHQRPSVPSVRSTFGTMTELLNTLRLMFSRLGSHCCPNGHHVPPSTNVARDLKLTCPVCGESFMGPSAESLSFNSEGACPTCSGTGVVRTVDESPLIPDESLSIDEGAVAPWNSLMWSLMTDVCRAMGVRTDIPYKNLTAEEKDIVLHGPAVKKHIFYKPKNSNQAGELDFTYYNAVYTVENALSKVKDDKGMKRVEKFLKEELCPDCHGSRLNAKARSSTLNGRTLPELCALPLDELLIFINGVPAAMPADLKELSEGLVSQFKHTAQRLLDLGLSYLSLDRAGSTLSTGELQRVQLARALRSRSTGVLYVLDEPSIGLHPANVDGLLKVIADLKAQGSSVVVVDHDVRVLKEADHLIEMGPGAGVDGGEVIAVGRPSALQLTGSHPSLIEPFIKGEEQPRVRAQIAAAESSAAEGSVKASAPVGAAEGTLPDDEIFKFGTIELEIGPIHTVKPLKLRLPKGRLNVITGVSGSGKTTVILESLIPALKAELSDQPLPPHVKFLKSGGISTVNVIDAAPIGSNIRSTAATYTGILDDLRRLYANTPEAKAAGKKAADFSYNTGSLRCPHCDGTGQITLDIQFLPDLDLPCPLCQGSRYAEAAKAFHIETTESSVSLPDLMSLTAAQALKLLKGKTKVCQKLKQLSFLGLDYLGLGEGTPALSGGEAQRLKIGAELSRDQSSALFVFDEPTIGLHPLDIRRLLALFDKLLSGGATLVVIEHDLDLIANADYIVDMGPGGGIHGGRIAAQGTAEEICQSTESLTGRYLRDYLQQAE